MSTPTPPSQEHLARLRRDVKAAEKHLDDRRAAARAESEALSSRSYALIGDDLERRFRREFAAENLAGTTGRAAADGAEELAAAQRDIDDHEAAYRSELTALTVLELRAGLDAVGDLKATADALLRYQDADRRRRGRRA